MKGFLVVTLRGDFYRKFGVSLQSKYVSMEKTIDVLSITSNGRSPIALQVL